MSVVFSSGRDDGFDAAFEDEVGGTLLPLASSAKTSYVVSRY